MVIYSDANNLVVHALPTAKGDGTTVDGHTYEIIASESVQVLTFQCGTVPDVGTNGATNEAILAIVKHRIGVLNARFPCRENSLAITKIEEAIHWLEARTRARIARDVEGKEVP